MRDLQSVLFGTFGTTELGSGAWYVWAPYSFTVSMHTPEEAKLPFTHFRPTPQLKSLEHPLDAEPLYVFGPL